MTIHDSVVSIREATADDAATIKQMIREENLDPTSLKWQHFLVAEHNETIVSIGQVKPYPGCNELGSLVTLPDYRGRGIARRIIAELEAREGYPMYLLCLAEMRPYYAQFGYEVIRWIDAPAVLKLKLLPSFLVRPFGIRVLVMRKNGTN